MADATSRRGPSPDHLARSVEAARALVRAARVLERTSTELSLAHYRVLSAIAAGDERASRVAERLELGKPTISAAVDALCQGGLVVRSEVEGDQRALALHLTAAGRALLERVEDEMVGAVDDLCARAPDPGALTAALGVLGVAVEERSAERGARRRAPSP